MACPVAIVLTFGAQHEAIQTTGLPDRVEPVEASSQYFVDVGLMAYVEEDTVGRSFKNGVERQGQFDDAEVWPEVSAGSGKGLHQGGANFGRQCLHLCGVESLEVSRRMDRLKQCTHKTPFPAAKPGPSLRTGRKSQ